MGKGYIDEAIVAYQKAISIKPEYAIALNNLGVVHLDGINDPCEALKLFSLAAKYNPNYTLAYYNKGRAYQKMENNTEAAKYFQIAIDINKITNDIDEEKTQNMILNLFSAD